MRQELENAMAIARSLAPGELLRFLVELREIELTALVRLHAPAPALRDDGGALLNVQDAAQHIHMSAKWVYRNLDVLPVTRIGNRVRFKKRSLDLWLEQHAIRRKS